MCGGEGVKEEYARASRKLRKLLGWRPMNELPPGDGEYPIQTINGTRDMIRYTRAFGWHFPKPSLLAGWFLLPPWPGEEPQ